MVSLLDDTPLGRVSDYIDTYTAELLCPISRDEARQALSLDSDVLPFQGVDIWTAYELSWLDSGGKPVVVMAEIQVPCDSACLIESKSLKLYLNSFANSRFESHAAVTALLEADLSVCAGSAVTARIISLDDAVAEPWRTVAGRCVDHIALTVDGFEYDPKLLTVEQESIRNEQLYSHLLRSRCPVTGQPDWATLIVRYQGAPICQAGLLRYVISLRNHQGFHEQIIERIYLDILQQCKPEQLTVYGRFTRRGGIDINPFRSNFEALPLAQRVVRQ